MNTYIEIKSVEAKTHDTSFGGYPWVITVIVKMDVKYWTKIKKSKELGQLYGIDISNIVYRLNNNIPAHNPSVNDTQRARDGIKTIQLYYYLKDAIKAEALGLKAHNLNDYVLIDSAKVFKLGEL